MRCYKDVNVPSVTKKMILKIKGSMSEPEVSSVLFYKWFEDGVLNVSYNCFDRYLII